MKLLISILFVCVLSQVPQSTTINKNKWKQLNHDAKCYTQGLSFINQTHLLQSCGWYGESYFQILHYADLKLTVTFKSNIFSKDVFLEGSILFPLNNIIYILTYQQKLVFRYHYQQNDSIFQELTPISWISQGWGMTHNNSHIFISDGSSFIYVVDENITILERIKVYDQNGKELIYINELEWFQDSNGKQYIYANVYTKNVLVKIDCDTHRVVNTYNLYQLTKKAKERTNLKHDQVLNGVAINPSTNTMFVTGKRWASAFIKQLNDV